MARQPVRNGMRKNVVLSESTNVRIGAIRILMDKPSDAEVIRIAVKLYSELMEFQLHGGVVQRTMDNQERIIDALFDHTIARTLTEDEYISMNITPPPITQRESSMAVVA